MPLTRNIEINDVNVNSWSELSVPSAPQYPEHSAGVRMGRELLAATRPFASEIKGKSRWYVMSTVVLTFMVLAGAGFPAWWPIRAVLSILGSMSLASALGGYLFFAQHSFKRMYVASPQAWSFYRAALESSSYIRLNKVMQWFTGNIGYHHIHHLNVRIPFYRLPEAMAAIPELQSPICTSLSPREILDCFRSCLWDEERQRMVSYREARALA